MLAAPIINGTLPAFYLENGIATIAVPFSMNRGINKSEIKGFSLKLKNVQGSSYLLTKDSKKIDYVNGIAYFELKEEELNNKFYVGLFYKAQLAYIELNETVGYYSTIGVIKYTTKPDVSILDMKKSLNNGHIYNYTGLYSQSGKDTSEKVYSYCFIVSDINDNIIEDTGWLIHNNSTDTNHYESFDTFHFDRDLLEGEKFKITYKVKTNNNLEISSPDYKIIAKKTVLSNLSNTKINVELNYENAYIDITFIGEKDANGYEIPVSGYYVLSRSSEDSNYTQWDEINRFTLAGQRPSKKLFKDFTIEQGKKYKYSIQQYNNKGLFSERVTSNTIYSDFEDMFLFDGNRQLKIKFNPKVSSFKIDRLEAKVDTLGSKYPFIFRNGNVEYKEFPISGLISYHMDEEGLFLFKELNLYKTEERELDNTYHLYDTLNTLEVIDDELLLIYQEEYKYCYIKYGDKYYTVDEGYEIIKTNPEYKKSQYGLYWQGHWDPVESKDVFTFFKYQLPTPGFYKQFKKVSNIIDFNNYRLSNTNLTSDNLYLEREFKLETLNWLSNGKPKLFKSPAEGNYLIRLMNISLNPNDTVGRMLHTFNSTAYEVANNNYNSLVQYGIIDTTNNINSYTKYMTIPLSSNDTNYTDLYSNIYKSIDSNSDIKYATGEIVPLGATLDSFTIEDMIPGTEIIIDGQKIIIGSTGTYSSQIPVSSVIIPMKQIEISSENEFNNLILYDKDGNLITGEYSSDNKIYYVPQYVTGQFNVVYNSEITNSFNNVLTTNTYDIYSHQFIGNHENIIKEIEDVATSILGFYNIKAYLRPLIDIEIIEDYELVPKGEVNEYNFDDYYINNFISNNTYKPITTIEYYSHQPERWLSIGAQSWNYYKKIITYKIKNSDTMLLKYDNYYETGNVLVEKGQMDNLYGYSLQINPSESFGTPLMKLVYFKNVSNSDKRTVENKGTPNEYWISNDDRDLKERQASNPMIMDIVRDFPLLAKEGNLYWFDKTAEPAYTRSLNRVSANDEYDLNKTYCLFVPYNEIITLECIDNETGNISKKYIPKDDYKDFIEFFEVYNQDLKETILPWDDTIYIDDFKINLTNSKHFKTGAVGRIKSLQSTSGTYYELFYQKQEIDYDVSKNYELQTLKNQLNNYKKILSREYMEEKCISDRGKVEYIEDRNEIVYGSENKKSYNELYATYINYLDRYLKQINEGV